MTFVGGPGDLRVWAFPEPASSLQGLCYESAGGGATLPRAG